MDWQAAEFRLADTGGIMNVAEIQLLCIISETQPTSYANLSMNSRLASHFLRPKLHDLADRGYIRLREGRYRLAKGVKETLLSGDHLDHWM